MRRPAVLVLCLLLAGCIGSPRTHFYTLDPDAPAAQAAAPVHHGRAKRPIRVGQVRLPATLDRLSLVRRSGPDQVAISEQDRWAAPLDGIISQTLAADLASRLPHGDVLAPTDPVPQRGERTLTVDVQDFVADWHGRVTLDARWTLFDGHPPRTVASAHDIVSVTASATDATAEVAAMSRALGEFADRIAARLSGG